jgi:hypothetical protein
LAKASIGSLTPATAAGLRAPDAVLHSVEVHGEFFGRHLVAAAAAEEYPQRLAQSLQLT